MNLLIITSVWTGAKPFFYEGKIESQGMPAFTNVFFRLLEDKRINKVHIVLWNLEDREIIIPEIYKDKVFVYPFALNGISKLASLFKIFQIIKKSTSLVKKNNIKRIIGFGSLAGISGIVGKLTGVSDFRRLYGSFLINEINKPKWKLFLNHPLEYLTFSIGGKGLMITNDGTKGDLVFNKIGNVKKLPFHFILNGIDKDIAANIIKPEMDLPDKFISYVARLDRWKRQNLLIEALGILKKQGVKTPKTIIVGTAHDLIYVEELKLSIKNNNLTEDDIVIVYGLPINQVHYILKNSLMTFSLYHTSNLGNVFIESLQLGTPMIAINDTGSLNLIEKEGFFELKSDDVSDIANAIAKLLMDSDHRNKLSIGAIAHSNRNIKSWKERAEYEIDLIVL